MPFTQEAKQALFNEVATAIFNQQRICKSGATCVYDDGRGNHCAIGHLLRARGVSLEGLDTGSLGGNSIGVSSAISAFRNKEAGGADDVFSLSTWHLLDGLKKIGADCEEDLQFLQGLQTAHDNSESMSGFADSMRGMAKRYELDAAVRLNSLIADSQR